MSECHYCNPLNVPYHYQFIQNTSSNELHISREGADPSLIYFHGKYYLFPSMNLSVWVSEDLAHWESYPLPMELPLYDYAPDVCIRDGYVYFCASRKGASCNFYRTTDILNGPYEEICGTFDFWDPAQFVDDDGRLYLYWGCDSITPIWGVELDPVTLRPLGERCPLIYGDPWVRGYERVGEDNSITPLSDEETEIRLQSMLRSRGLAAETVPPELLQSGRGLVGQRPYIEGAWMTKHGGKYYLQYACSGSEYNVYGDGVYVSDAPLGPFVPAVNNPYSYKPGGFLPGAGHGSTLKDAQGCFWHTATMRISVNHVFERRVGLWPAGFDEDGELFCNQRYGDWPLSVEKARSDPWAKPEWMLLSYGKAMTCSSSVPGKGPERACDENVRTWWRAAEDDAAPWLQMDLGQVMDIHAVQVNFADDKLQLTAPFPLQTGCGMDRYIDENLQRTRWIIESSTDGANWNTLVDKSKAETSLPHDFMVLGEGISLRYLKLTVLETPYRQTSCVSGLRIFGLSEGSSPEAPIFTVCRSSDLDMIVKVDVPGALGYNILWGHAPHKLYHSCMVFGESEKRIGALVKGQDYYIRVDAFNEAGITEGNIRKL